VILAYCKKACWDQETSIFPAKTHFCSLEIAQLQKACARLKRSPGNDCVALGPDQDERNSSLIRWIVMLAGILGVVGVAIGANAAHGLEGSLIKQGIDPTVIAKRLQQCDVAVRYHMTHTVALLAIGYGTLGLPVLSRTIAAIFLLLGIGLFSGGLYSMVYLGVMGHWAIVPSGGLCFIIGWIAVAASAIFDSNRPRGDVARGKP
jgi:uncharacterized membrane protein YgdD (TMEM256/DUF423 family)